MANQYVPVSFQLLGVERVDGAPGPSAFLHRLSFKDLPEESLIDRSRAEAWDAWVRATSQSPLIYAGRTSRGAHLVAKMESALPFESHYDRAFVRIIRSLEQSGAIRPGDDLIEITSGNAGISFAAVCQTFGYRAHVIVAPETMPERVQPMIDLGADVYVSGRGGLPAATRAMKVQMNWFRKPVHGYRQLDHFNTENDPVFIFESGDHRVCFPNHSWLQTTVEAFKGISAEVERVLGGASQPVTHLISALGNWTTTAAMATQLAEWELPPKLIGVEDRSHAPMTALFHPQVPLPAPGPHQTPGTGSAGVNIRFADIGKLDGCMALDKDQFLVLQAAYNEGKADIDQIGRSTALCMASAERIGEEGDVIVYPAYDNWDRYFDRPPQSDVCSDPNAIPSAGLAQAAVADVTDLPRSVAELARLQHPEMTSAG